MRLSSTTAMSLAASAALAAGMLAVGAGTTASANPVTTTSIVGGPSLTTGGDALSATNGPSDVRPGDVRAWDLTRGHSTPAPGLLPGDVRVWELTHGYSVTAPGLLPGDVRVWELQHPWRG